MKIKFIHCSLFRYTVTGEKLHLFLDQVVVGRNRRSGAGSIGLSSVSQYAAAIVDLYKEQQQLRINAHPHPRNAAVNALLRNVEMESRSLARRNYDDRGAGTILDGYTIDQLEIFSSYFLSKATNPGVHIRNRMIFLMQHFCIMRGEDIRNMELADLFGLNLPNESSVQECFALVTILRQGKTNQFNRIEYGSALRNANVNICPVGALALHLFWRFHVNNEVFPDMTNNLAWFDEKLSPRSADQRTEAISYMTHLKFIKELFQAMGLTTKAKTHCARGSAARHADILGADESHIRRLGRWNPQAMEGCYVTTMPIKAMRALAGFGNDRSGTFFIARAGIIPPVELQRLIFPQIEIWEERLRLGTDCVPSVAAGGFLELLKRLRIVLLQDSVILVQTHGSNQLFQHEIFRTEEYIGFKEELLSSVEEAQNPPQLLLQSVVPDIATEIGGMRREIAGQLNHLTSLITSTSTVINNVFTGRAPVFLRMMESPSEAITDHGGLETEINSQQQPPVINADVPNAFTMSRNLSTVPEVYREWYHGIPPNLSVVEMDEIHGASWRRSAKDRQFYCRRKKIIRAIERLAQERGINGEAAAAEMENHRQTRSWSLNKLSNQLIN